jgi:alpha-beta hydrolase superfamily lysophospholipase
VVEEYNKDPLCGLPFTLNGYYALMNLILTVYSKLGWITKNKSLPVMFVSGANDPCRRSDKAFKKAVNHLKRCGYPNTFFKLYEDMRHELFNEPDCESVYNDILKFLEIKANIETN